MASRETDSASNGSSVEGKGGNEDWEDNGNSRSETLGLKTLKSRQKSVSGEGSSNNMEQLVRLPLPGRKAHRKTCSEAIQGRWKEGGPDREEGKHGCPLLGGRKVEKQKQRKSETHEETTQERNPRESILEAGAHHPHRGPTSPEPRGLGSTQTLPASSNPQFSQAAVQSKFTPLSSHRPSPADVLSDTRIPSRNPDAPWVEVRTSEQPIQAGRAHIPPLTLSEPEEEEEEEDLDEETAEEEEGRRLTEVTAQASASARVKPCALAGERRMSKREKNRMKSLRRRQRRREKWRQGQQQESKQSLTGNQSSSSSSTEDEESLSMSKREGFICAVCLDVYFSPYICHPCNHIFCEPCLRTLAKNSPTNTPCPLCRTVITHVFFQKELNQAARTFFPKEYLTRKQNFQKASCAKWPLPSCRKIFRIFGAGFQRQSSPIPRRQFPHGGGYRLNTMDFEDESRGWRFDMDMVIIYIYSVNWVIGFFVFCFLCYLFFPAF